MGPRKHKNENYQYIGHRTLYHCPHYLLRHYQGHGTLGTKGERPTLPVWHMTVKINMTAQPQVSALHIQRHRRCQFLKTAGSILKALCKQEEGVRQFWMWSVTDMCTTGSRLFVFRVCAGDFPSRCLPSATQENLEHDSLLGKRSCLLYDVTCQGQTAALFSASFLLFIKRERLNETHG